MVICMNREEIFQELEAEIGDIVEEKTDHNTRLQRICDLLAKRVPHYHWVGFYLVDPERPGELVLGPYIGEPTDHVLIPFGKGVCGQAARLGKTMVIGDVSREENYLSCSVHVRSEIVVPVIVNGEVVGEIDIDSHTPDTFTEGDREFLEGLARMVAPVLGMRERI